MKQHRLLVPERLWNERVRRMAKLISLNAPAVIIWEEAKLLAGSRKYTFWFGVRMWWARHRPYWTFAEFWFGEEGTANGK